MNMIIAIYVASVVMILVSMTYVVYTMYKSRPSIDKFADTAVGKVSVPGYSVQEIDRFLTPEECDHIIAISKDRLQPSKIYSDSSDVYDTASRKSDQAWIKDGDDPLVASISQKVAKLSGLPAANQEDLQVVSYGPGGFFTPHYDACDGNTGFCERMDGKAGPRLLTYLIYLNDDFEGGETLFPKLNMSVRPKKGKCVVFKSTLPDGRIILEALHGGNPVKSGHKWICNKWVRANRYEAPPAPPATS